MATNGGNIVINAVTTWNLFYTNTENTYCPIYECGIYVQNSGNYNTLGSSYGSVGVNTGTVTMNNRALT